MNRRHFMKVSGGAAILSSAASAFGSVRGTKGAGADGAANAPAFPTRVISRTPPLRWEDAMISGNGPTGIMVMGLPLDDLVIVNHEKLWVVNSEYKPEAPDLRRTWAAARRIAPPTAPP